MGLSHLDRYHALLLGRLEGLELTQLLVEDGQGRIGRVIMARSALQNVGSQVDGIVLA